MKGQNEIKFYSYYILSTQLSRCKKENGNDEKKMFPNGTSGSGGMGKAGGFFLHLKNQVQRLEIITKRIIKLK